jgi:hypothetical protein
LLPVLVMDRSKSCAAIDVNDSMRDVNAVTTESAADPALPVPAKLVLLPSLDSPPPPGLPPPLALLALLLALDKGGRFCHSFGGRGGWGVEEPAGENESGGETGRGCAFFQRPRTTEGRKWDKGAAVLTRLPLPGFSCFCRALINCRRSYLRCQISKGRTRGCEGAAGVSACR